MKLATFILPTILHATPGFRVPGAKCPDVKGMPGFDPARYANGKPWWQSGTSRFLFTPASSTCVTATYSLTENEGQIYYQNDLNLLGSIPWQLTGYAQEESEGTLCVEFDEPFPAPEDGCDRYIVMETDYENYAYVYSCDDKSANSPFPGEPGSDSILWALTREPTSDEAYVRELYANAAGYIARADPSFPVDELIDEMVMYDNSDC